MRKNTKKYRLVQAAKEVIEGYTTSLTIRQIYYRLVAKHLIPNTVSSYQMVVAALRDARLEGLIDYSRIEDRSRHILGSGSRDYQTPEEHFNDAKSYYLNSHKYYRLPKWKSQSNYVIVLIEKQALEALFEEVTSRWGVKLGPCKGYPSLTFVHDIAEDLNEQERREEVEEIVIIYAGDFDPSGLDIPRYIKERMISDLGVTSKIKFKKIAITLEQIEKYNIPPMPTKTTDSRAGKFMAEHGEVSSVELDALEPDVLQQLVEQAIKEEFNQDIYEQVKEELEEAREEIRAMIGDSINEKD